MEGKRLRIPTALITLTFCVLSECGQARNECVVYWTAPVDSPELVDDADHPAHRRSAAGYEIETSWLTEYWFCLARTRRAIRAQVHTHPGAAFHSLIDDHWPIISQPGFLSIVIPDFATGSVSLDEAWIGQVTADGRWRHMPTEAALELVHDGH